MLRFLTENSTIRSLLTGCCRNDRSSQKQLFQLLDEFALRICYRYAGIGQDHMICVYESFLKLYKNLALFPINLEFNELLQIKNWFKTILIETCIEFAQQENQFSLNRHNSSIEGNSELFRQLSNKELIDRLRMLAFPHRVVYNLSVIDNFELKEISNKLMIQPEDVTLYLQHAKDQLRRLISPVKLNETA